MTNILTPGYLRWDGTKYTTDPDIEIVGPVGPPGIQGIQGIPGPTGPTGAQGDVPGARLLTASTGLQGGGNLTADRSFNVNPNLTLTSLTIGASTATVGEIRLGVSGRINFRNFTNTTDLTILTTDSSNDVILGDATNSNSVIVNVGTGSSNLQVRVSSSPIFALTASSCSFTLPLVQFATTISLPAINQADNPINSATATNFTIHAQNATGTGSTVGGNLILVAGTGSTIGSVQLQAGSSAKEMVINGANNRIDIIGLSSIRFDTAITTPTIFQADKTTNSGVGATLNIQAQNETGTSSTGGGINIFSGFGTSVSGTITLQTGSGNSAIIFNDSTLSIYGDNDAFNIISYQSHALLFGDVGITASIMAQTNSANIVLNSAFNLGLNALTFNNGQTPIISQANNTTNSATAATFTIQAANATGTSATGGALSLTGGSGVTGGGLILAAGAGSSVSGQVTIKSGAVVIMTLGGNSPLSLASNVLSLTSGTTTLSGLQLEKPLIAYSASLTGNITIDFTNVAGLWFLDIVGVTLNGYSVSIKSGVATTTLTIPSGQTLFVIRTSGFNTISYC